MPGMTFAERDAFLTEMKDLVDSMIKLNQQAQTARDRVEAMGVDPATTAQLYLNAGGPYTNGATLLGRLEVLVHYATATVWEYLNEET